MVHVLVCTGWGSAPNKQFVADASEPHDPRMPGLAVRTCRSGLDLTPMRQNS